MNKNNDKDLVSLFVGIDVSKDFFDICMMQTDGTVVRTFRIDNNHRGFSSLLDNLPGEDRKLFAFERTGPYSGNFRHFLDERGLEYRILNSFKVSRLRDVFSFRRKNDVVDSWILAQAIRMDALEHSGSDQEYIILKDILERYYDLKDRHTTLINQLHSAAAESFPELPQAFYKFHCNASMAIFSAYPTAERFARANTKDILKVVRLGGGRISRARIEALKTQCSKTVAWKTSKTSRNLIQSRIRELKMVKNEISIILKLRNEYIENTFPEQFRLLRSVPGVGDKIAAHLLATIGDHRRFDPQSDGKGAKRLSSFVGYGVIEYSSGQTTRKYGISKRGDSKLRGLLFMASVTALREDPWIAERHRNKAKRSTRMTAMISTSHLLLRRAYGVLNSGRMYNSAIPQAG